jgi:hypothetical protein
MAAYGNRSILPTSLDNKLAPASYVSGADSSLDERPPYTQPTRVTDQTSAATDDDRANLANAFRDAQRDAQRIGADAGAGGTVVAPSGQFEQIGTIFTDSTTVVAPNQLVTRSDGADSGVDGTGKAVG